MMREHGTCQGWVHSLQNATGVNKDVGFVFDDGIRIVALLNLDVPHLIIFVPVSTHYSVVQPDVFVQVILLRHILEILKDFWCARVASREDQLVSINFPVPGLSQKHREGQAYNDVHSLDGAHEN